MTRPPRQPGPFRLTRYFLSASLVGMVVVMACLIWVYRTLAERQLVEHETQANQDVTLLFANAMWPHYRAFVLASAGRTRDDLLHDPLQASMRADVLAQMHGLRIVKVKVYNRGGTTVFSTDAKQVGEDKSGNDGFKAALADEVRSLITFRERFDAFEGEVNDRNLIGTYVPVRSQPGEPPEAVFEVYSDVTGLIAAQQRALVVIVAAVLSALGALYAFQYGVVRRASGLLAEQEAQRLRHQAELEHQAHHDPLTGLPNRAFFVQRISEALAQASRRHRQGALVFLDLDHFKHVNDTLGHAAGDELLRQMSSRIAACLRAGDALFRMGGDEFTLILGEVAGPDEAAEVAHRIEETVARPVTVLGHEVQVGVSIGIALFPDDARNADELLTHADAAMYRAKQTGRGRHTFYEASLSPA